MSKFHIFGGDWVIQPVKTEKLRGIKLFYPPGSSLTRQALIWGSFRVFFARLPRRRVGGSAYRRIGVLAYWRIGVSRLGAVKLLFDKAIVTRTFGRI